jgi:hypothetical protein
LTNELDHEHDEPVVRANTQSVRDFRWRQRGTTAERHAQSIYLKSNRGLLERQWSKQWARISDDEQASILAQHKTAIDALFEITQVINGLSTGLQPGVTMLYPDITYGDFAAIPRSNTFPDVDVASRMDVKDFDAQDDEAFRNYGKITKVPSVIWSEFCRLTLAWARANPGDCDAGVQAELEQTVITNVRPPETSVSPCSRAGLRQPTTSEERGALAHQRDLERTQRQMAEADKRGDDVYL